MRRFRSPLAPIRLGARPRALALLVTLLGPVLEPGPSAQGCSVGAPFETGQVTVLGTSCSGEVPNPSACYTLRVHCDGLPPIDVDLGVYEPPMGVTVRGTVIFGMGGAGIGFYVNRPGSAELFQLLTDNGFRCIDRRWYRSWFGDGYGVRRQSCRYATLLRWVEQNLHTSGLFGASGNSGGSSEVGYALTTWGLDTIIDVALPTGGPSMSRLDYLCRPSSFWSATCPGIIPQGPMECTTPDCDLSPEDRACVACSISASPMDLELDSVLHPSAVLDFPTTRVHQILGAADCCSAIPMAHLFHDAVTSEKVIEVIPGSPHWIPTTDLGREAMLRALLGAEKGAARPSTLAWTTWPTVGGPVSLEVSGPAAMGYRVYWSPVSGLAEFPGLGWGFLSAPVRSLSSGTLDGQGAGSLTLAVPNNPSLVGYEMFLQALVDGTLSNRVRMQIDG